MSMNIALAIYGLESELERELKYRTISFEKRDRLYFFNTDYRPLFAQVTWIDYQTITIGSIGEGIKKLKALGKNWALFSIGNHRRAQLIQDGLPKIKNKPVHFLAEQPQYPMGGWTMLDAHTIVCSTETTSRYPLGKIEFIENKQEPPSRAYLKLWEFFTVHCIPPEPGTQVIDMGAAPGGWSWVLSQLDLKVISVDKAPLNERIAQESNISFLQESVFGLDLKKMHHIEWLFSDIVCYPERLFACIKRWMQESTIKHFVCTVKFQGKADFAIIDAFHAILGSRMVHLYHNKHELTWWLVLDKV